MPSGRWRIAPLLFASGLCALVYQVAWLREFRLIFGASTAASAAVVAIFIGGLGIGGFLFGRRADRHPAPLALYARLETLIALSAALTPGLLWLARAAYVATGGTLTLGLAGGTLLRLLLATLVLAVPTLLMGGTLPAAARSVTSADDEGRRAVGLLYGVNTLGAVSGCVLANFFMLEVFGTRATLWLACLVNLLVAIAARQLARGLPQPPPRTVAELGAETASAPAGFVLASSAVVGFAFFLMELVWYRMLGPLLGGTVFTFGLILAVALFGIGLGGLVYALLGSDRRATLLAFAWSCLVEGACIAAPYALGDRLAVLALALRSLGQVAMFWGYVLGWALVCGVVVLPAALVAGFQFPMLISLLGRGREDVGRQIGLAYAWNTVGAILGALAGGFGAVPLLSAPGAWRATSLLLAALGLAALALALRSHAPARLLAPAALAVLVVWLAAAQGPTALWRHGGIGAGRASIAALTTPNALHEWSAQQRRIIRWEADGVESSVALEAFGPGLAFVINGKVDGNARSDVATMVMSGLLGAILHPEPKRSLVIGLGAGATAGWLAAIPSMARTDVVELEPLVLNVARACAGVNHDVMANPKVRIAIGDARESLLVSHDRYDVIFSEPSNPYRAGVASLFTREYYEAVARRLDKGGLFLQWVQAYEIDNDAIRSVYATLLSVFPHVETWQVGRADLVLVASQDSPVHDLARLRARLAEEPYRSAALYAWRVWDAEGFLSHFVARDDFARFVAARGQRAINSDDRNLIEFAFARSLGRLGIFSIAGLRDAARARGEDRVETSGAAPDWQRVEEERIAFYPHAGEAPVIEARFRPEERALAAAFSARQAGNATEALAAFRRLHREPRTLLETELVAAALAESGDEAALPYIEHWRSFMPVEADVFLARMRAQEGRADEAVAALESALAGYRSDPWPLPELMRPAIDFAVVLGSQKPEYGARMLAALGQPFALSAFEDERHDALAELLPRLDLKAHCASLLRPLEPNVPWSSRWLALRSDCYAATNDPLLGKARAELLEFQSQEPMPFGAAIGVAPR